MLDKQMKQHSKKIKSNQIKHKTIIVLQIHNINYLFQHLL